MAPGSDGVVACLEHCYFCFEALVHHLHGDPETPLPQPKFQDASAPLFVTWYQASRRGQYQLRGCIGTFEARQLHTGLHEYALTSALRDSRFAPIQSRELPTLKCGVSLLGGFEVSSGWLDWAIGQHGMIIEFPDPVTRARRTATFLPEVAGEQGWTKEQTIQQLIRKAGCHAPVDAGLLHSIKLTRYQSTKSEAPYEEYAALASQAAALSATLN